MSLNIRVDNPANFSNAVLPFVPNFADVVNGVSGLVGLWEASSIPDGEAVSLAPTYGTVPLNRNAAGANKSTIGGRPAVAFDATNTRLAASWPVVGGSPATLMASFYVRTATGDFQNLYGPSSGRIIYRDGSNGAFPRGLQWSGGANFSPMPLTAPVVGWHLLELYFGAATLRMRVDGIEYSVAQAGITNNNLIFGNQAQAGSSTSLAFGKMFAANSDIYGTADAGYIRDYISR